MDNTPVTFSMDGARKIKSMYDGWRRSPKNGPPKRRRHVSAASPPEDGHGIALVEPLIEAADWTAGDLFDSGGGSIEIPNSTYGIFQLHGDDASGIYRYVSIGSRQVFNPWPFRFNSASFNSGIVRVAKDGKHWFISGAQNLFAMVNFGGSTGSLSLTLIGGYSILTAASGTQCNAIFKASALWFDVSLSGSRNVSGTVSLLRNGGAILSCTEPGSSGGPFSARKIVSLSEGDQLTVTTTGSGSGTVTGQVVIKPCLDMTI